MDTLCRDVPAADIPKVCRSCEARHGGICGAMTPQQLAELNKYTSRKHVCAGAELYGQGENVTNYANILKGVVKLTKVMPDGRQQIVGLQFAPDFLGRPFATENALSAEATTDVEVCAIPKAALDRMVKTQPDLEHMLYKQALAELDEARDWMLTLGRKTAQEKVATFLFLIATHYDPESVDSTTFDLPLSRADIADFLGLTIETVSRQLTKLRSEGVITIENNRHVTVPNLDRLAHIAGIDI
jgi:CRP/FNR family transcriptional regulator